MPRNTRKTDGTPHRRNAGKNKQSPQDQAEQRESENERRFVDRTTEGLGLAAQDLPGAEHGQNVVDPPDQMQRNLPQQHGGELADPNNYSEGGLRGSRDLGDSRGSRKRN